LFRVNSWLKKSPRNKSRAFCELNQNTIIVPQQTFSLH
jgi:hypothetical protein